MFKSIYASRSISRGRLDHNMHLRKSWVFRLELKEWKVRGLWISSSRLVFNTHKLENILCLWALTLEVESQADYWLRKLILKRGEGFYMKVLIHAIHSKSPHGTTYSNVMLFECLWSDPWLLWQFTVELGCFIIERDHIHNCKFQLWTDI